MKEIIYTAIFIGLGLLLIALLLIMFRPGRKTQSASAPRCRQAFPICLVCTVLP